MTKKFTMERALTNLDNFSEEWVEKDLEKGIAVPFRHWRNGHRKELLSFFLWKNLMVPFVFTVFVILSVKVKVWSLFAVLLPCYIIYCIAFLLIKRREDASFILKMDGITIVTPKDKMFIPWEAVQNITSTEDGVEHQRQTGFYRLEKVYATGYNLAIQVGNRYYVFYEIYPRSQVVDQEGQINRALMSLHVAYKVLKAAYKKVNNN